MKSLLIFVCLFAYVQAGKYWKRSQNDWDWNWNWDWDWKKDISTRGIANGPVCQGVEDEEDCLKDVQKAMDKALGSLDEVLGIRNLRGGEQQEQQQRNVARACDGGFAGCYQETNEFYLCWFMAPVSTSCRRRNRNLWWFSFGEEQLAASVTEDDIKEVYNDICFVDSWERHSLAFAEEVRENMSGKYTLGDIEIKLQVRIC